MPYSQLNGYKPTVCVLEREGSVWTAASGGSDAGGARAIRGERALAAGSVGGLAAVLQIHLASSLACLVEVGGHAFRYLLHLLQGLFVRLVSSLDALDGRRQGVDVLYRALETLDHRIEVVG